ncbi:Pre-rRNA-processing protein TSR2-domain-containing protein [Melanogaster broomeanus]|nr:Pre-rRNA-processing protein TSR2-domain-containing protein [Melanogaster broomeanus]
MSSSSTPSAQPHSLTVLFARGIIARLALWPALRLAVHQSWGGPDSAEKQRWLAGVIVDQFEEFITSSPSLSSSPSFADYIEELLLQVMSDEFDVSLEDDSASAVSRDIVTLFSAICTGDDTFVKELEAQADRIRGKAPQYEVGAGSGSDWEDDDDDDDDDGESGIEDAEGGEGEEVAPQLLDRSGGRKEEAEIDEDGFTIVKKKGRR